MAEVNLYQKERKKGKLLELIRQGNVEEALNLLDVGISFNEKDDDIGSTPLHCTLKMAM